jgi:hypothetical protein
VLLSVRAAMLAALLPAAAMAQHFAVVYIDIRLLPNDSITVAVEADAQDMMNTVFTFPTFGDTGIQAFRQYENRMEYYLQQKVKLRAGGKSIFLRGAAWKKDGKNREDGLDSISILTSTHAFTMGGRLPKGTKSISIVSDFWDDRPEIDHPPIMEYFLFEDRAVRRRVSAPTGRLVTFPIVPDSLSKMSRHPPRIPPRETDHSGHDH